MSLFFYNRPFFWAWWSLEDRETVSYWYIPALPFIFDKVDRCQ